PRHLPGRPRLRTGRAPLPARLRAGPGLAGPYLVHGRGDGPLPGPPGRGAAGGRRLAGPVAPLGGGPRAGGAPHGDHRGAADSAGVRPSRGVSRRGTGARRRHAQPLSALTPAVTATATATTTRNGARRTRATAAAPTPAARASRTSDWPSAKVCCAVRAASRATGSSAASRLTRGRSRTPAGTRRPASLTA